MKIHSPLRLGLFLGLDVLVDALRAGFARAHREDDRGAAGDGVAAGKDALARGHAALVGLDAALLREGQALGRVADQGVGAGADGDDDGVDV